MAEDSITFQSSDLFALGGDFHAQTSSTTVTRERDTNLASDGDVACESDAFNVTTNYSAEYEFCGSDLETGLGTFLNAFGGVEDSKLVTGLDIDFNNKEYPSVSIEGHNHAQNPHTSGSANIRKFDLEAALTLGLTVGGVGVPAISGITVGAANAINAATISASFEHMDVEDETGDHFDGQNRTCRVDLTISGIGPASGITVAGNWIIDDLGDEDGNSDPDSFNITCHQFVDAT